VLIKRLAIVGAGLIGGSFSLALKRAGCVGRVVGVGRSPANLAQALELGIIDEIGTDFASALHGADFVLVATPVRQMQSLFASLAPHLSPDAVVTDAGSTKQDVIAAARAALGARIARFVPGHPIAGREKSGAAAAQAELYRERNVVLTPLAENAHEDVERVSAAWRACGARVVQMDAAVHDGVFAAVSHLPHMLAYALVDDIAARDNAQTLFSFAAGGFRDFTRIASSSPEMWRDIALGNRDALLEEIDRFRDKLAQLRALVAQGDAAALEKMMSDARDARDAWLARSTGASQSSPE